MMQQQSIEWITGYSHAHLDKKAFNIMKEDPNIKKFECAIHVPMNWFGIKNPTYYKLKNNPNIDFNPICKKIEETLMDLYTKWNVSLVKMIDKQYIVFTAVFIKKKKKLTISEIENLLGYEIEIVKENNNDNLGKDSANE